MSRSRRAESIETTFAVVGTAPGVLPLRGLPAAGAWRAGPAASRAASPGPARLGDGRSDRSAAESCAPCSNSSPRPGAGLSTNPSSIGASRGAPSASCILRCRGRPRPDPKFTCCAARGPQPRSLSSSGRPLFENKEPQGLVTASAESHSCYYEQQSISRSIREGSPHYLDCL